MRIWFSRKFKQQNDISADRIVDDCRQWIEETCLDLGIKSKIAEVYVLSSFGDIPSEGRLDGFFGGIRAYLCLNVRCLIEVGKGLVMHEFGHLRDFLDPDFGYSLDKWVDLSEGCSIDCVWGLINSVWDISLERRLANAGYDGIGRDRVRITFGKELPFRYVLKSSCQEVEEETDRVFNILWEDPPLTFNAVVERIRGFMQRYPHIPCNTGAKTSLP